MEVQRLKKERRQNEKKIFKKEVESMKINMQKHDEVQSSMLIKDIERMIKSNHKKKQVQERSKKI